jgi:hypothetical protein
VTQRSVFRAALLLAWLIHAPSAPAQTVWTVDPKLSLAWWQVVPHLGHLWATTCPSEPSWQPGEGRSAVWTMDKIPAHEGALTVDTMKVPRYPRPTALPLCRKAVEGKVVVADSIRWQGIRGEVRVTAAALVTGNKMRDEYAREEVLQVRNNPEIQLTIDSVVVTTRRGDTLQGTAAGMFTLRRVSRPVTATVQAWPEAGGLRVLARFPIPAQDLVPVYRFSKMALGLGIGTKIWQYVFAGVDLVLIPDQATRD